MKWSRNEGVEGYEEAGGSCWENQLFYMNRFYTDPEGVRYSRDGEESGIDDKGAIGCMRNRDVEGF